MKIWIYKDGAQQGPFDYEELTNLEIGPDTKVWFSGMPKWAAAAEVPELAGLFGGGAAPVQAPQPPEAPAVTAEGDTSAQNYDQQGYEQGYVPQQSYEPQQDYEQPQQGYEYCTCEAPGAAAPEVEPCPPAYLPWTIILTVLCCSPVAVAALITSIYTGVYYRRGNMSASHRASEATAWLIMVTIALGALPSMILSLMF